MTNLSTDTHRQTHDARASAAMLAEHSDDRWADWKRRGVEGDARSRRRFTIIASVIGVGLVAWLLATLG